jgi:glycosyltransferase involved in cell wall biosynthesis
VLLLPEVMFDGQSEARANWARARGFKAAAILYDLIPIYYSELCDPTVRAGFPAYLEALVGVDAVWSISEFTLQEYGRYLREVGLNLPRIHEVIHLPGQFSEQPRTHSVQTDNHSHETRILFISTLEPRKNHLRLLQAFERLRVRRPDLRLRLVLIGNRYASAPEIAEQVQAAAQRDASIEWLGTIDDARLAREFENCSFTVYPSLVEGYGLPIVESLWMGRPCLAHNGGVMQELAVPGGCLTTDMTDADSIMQALERMATDESLLARLRDEASERKITTWQDYADEIAGRLNAL